MSTRKHKTLTLMEKLQLLSEAKCQTKSALSKKFGCSLETVNRILRSEKNLIELSKTNKLLIKRNRSGMHKNVEDALKLWYDQMRSTGAPVSTNLLLKTAQQLAVKLNENFNPSVGWLWRWQRREGVQLRKVKSKDQSEADNEPEEAYKHMTVRDLLASYQAIDIFSAAETGLLYKSLPLAANSNGTINEQKDTKYSNERLTVLLVCNATGEYKRVFVIGKTQSPKCFKNKTIPIKYYSNKKAWMTQKIWSDILQMINVEMIQQRRKIIMFVDNAEVHKNIEGLTNIKLHFLLPNKTSHTQPFNLGILHTFKAHYRKNIIRRQLAALECGNSVDEFLKSMDLFKCLNIIKNSWSLVQPPCIRICFKKAGLLPKSEGDQEDLGPMKDNTEEYLFDNDKDFNQTYNEYIDCDANEPCYGQLTDTEGEEIILLDASPGQTNVPLKEEEEMVVNKEGVSCNPIPDKDLLLAVELLEQHFLSENKFSEELDQMRAYIIDKKIEHAKQT